MSLPSFALRAISRGIIDKGLIHSPSDELIASRMLILLDFVIIWTSRTLAALVVAPTVSQLPGALETLPPN
jgi:hypothetical protein